MDEYTQKINDFIYAILFSLIIFFLWKSGILYSYSFFPILEDKKLYLFGDWSVFIKISECYKYGVNIYVPNKCALTVLNIGNIILYIPFYKNLDKFYKH